MNNNILETLNEEQLIALKQTEGAVLVTAGAGSGKTRLLTNRIVFLIECLNIPPKNILAITFTNKASNEMKERVQKMTIKGDNVWISTFHSMCVKILRQHISKLNPSYNSNFSIYSDLESEKVITTILTQQNIVDSKFKKKILFHLSNIKNNNYSLEEYQQILAFDINKNLIINTIIDYQKTLKQSNALDFDDLLICTYKLFKSCPEVLEYYANRFKYILVDEFQDTNTIQYELVKLLASKHKNIFVVGDEDQCIYTWRGANFKNISNFKEDFPNVKIFKLEQNYRSTSTILECANSLIKNNKSRIDKTLWCENQKGEPIQYREIYDEQNEADFICKTIYNLVHNFGYCYNDFAILIRLNALSLPFEEKLLAYNIPHKIYGGFKFYDRTEIKNVLAYLKLIINPKDNQAFLRIINFPKRAIGTASVEKIRELANENSVSLMEIVLNNYKFDLPNSLKTKLNIFVEIYTKLIDEFEQTPLNEFVGDVIKYFNIKSVFNNQIEEDINKIMNIDQLLNSVETYVSKNPTDTLADYLLSVSLISDMDNMDNSDNVTVATVHSVKGLEFRTVFLAGLEEKIFPISRAFEQEEQMEEERRLMYVGITRAKERLFLTNCKTRYLYGHRDYMLPSRFLNEIGFTQKSYTPIYNSTVSRKVAEQVDFIKKSITPINTTTYSQYIQNNKQKNDLSKFVVGKTILHTKFGIGKIVAVNLEEKTADINFDNIGCKTFMMEIAPLKFL